MPKIFLLVNQQGVLTEDVSRECGFFLCLFNFFDLNLTYFPPYYRYYGSGKDLDPNVFAAAKFCYIQIKFLWDMKAICGK